MLQNNLESKVDPNGARKYNILGEWYEIDETFEKFDIPMLDSSADHGYSSGGK